MDIVAIDIPEFLAMHGVSACIGCGAVVRERDMDPDTLEYDPLCWECAASAEHARELTAFFRGPR